MSTELYVFCSSIIIVYTKILKGESNGKCLMILVGSKGLRPLQLSD